MSQTVLTLVSELLPSRLAAARRSIQDLKQFVEANSVTADPYEGLALAIPDLHFASIMVFEDERYDPVLTVELNFDGPAGSFLPQLETPLLTQHLRAILRCCKPPSDARAAMFAAIMAPGAKLPLAPYLETLIVRPAVFHQGNRGLDRARILAEAKVFVSVQQALETPAARQAMNAGSLHTTVRSALLPAYPWLDAAEPLRIPFAELLRDMATLGALIVVVLAALVLPGLILAAAFPVLTAGISWLVVVAALCLGAFLLWKASRTSEIATVATAPPAAEGTGSLKIWSFTGLLICVGFCVAFPIVRAALASLLCVVASALVYLRHVETSDTVHEDPKIDPTTLHDIMALEDQIAQNHMGSVVHVKPGILRAIVIRLGLHGLGALLRVTATKGYLADMRTIHFAHWALIDNGSRLLFFSNFDSSWESYLDDFIEKAHAGLTLAWSNGVGFPRTRYLVQDGATQGRLFKAWARHSMAVSLFWFSAYRDLSVNQIERNALIASGLRRRSLSGAAADQWAALL